MTLSRGIKINNPGDLRVGLPLFQGEISPSSDPDFRQFDTIENGIRAVAVTLMTYFNKHGLKTLREMANRYAPPSENDTGLYCSVLSERTGYDEDSVMDFPADLLPVTKAFIVAEQGENVHQITDEQFQKGVNSALGII